MADARALQRKIARIKQIEIFSSGNLLSEPIERIKTNINLLNEEWNDYKSTAQMFGDTQDIIVLQEQLETKYFTIKGKLMQAELTLNKDQNSIDLDTSLHDLMANQRSFLHEVSNLNNRESDARLPRINIPQFSGVYSEFASFRDLFEASINKNVKMSKVTKFQYLKGYLKGEAAALVRHVAITEANYDEAWSMIINRYDKKKHVVNMLLKQFMDQPSITQVSSKSLHNLRDVSDEVIRGLKVLDEAAQTRDPWLIYILVNKLDQITKRAWAQHSYEWEFPTIQQFFEFLNKQSDTLESCEPPKRASHRQALNTEIKVMQLDTQFVNCLKCGKDHYLRNCEEFLKLSVNERRGFVASNKLCFVCLFQNHQSHNCRSRYRCGICRAKHHSTLHQENSKISTQISVARIEDISKHSTPDDQNMESLKVAHTISPKRFTAILPTAIIRVLDSANTYQKCRVLLDSGAQASFITESCARRLALPRTHAKILIKGLTPGMEMTKGKLSINVASLYSSSDTMKLDVLILNKLTGCLPSREINAINLMKLNDLPLADPHFNKPGLVDIIIGADRFFEILREGQINNLSDHLIAQNSMFGWLLSGEVMDSDDRPNSTSLNYHIDLNVDDTLKQFWEIEEMPTINSLTDEESKCEEYYKTHLRRDSGRYIVKLPLKNSRLALGNSLSVATKRFYNLEDKLNRDPELRSEYIKVIREYLSLGHMREIQVENRYLKDDEKYYLPHHAVTKAESSTTKIRVVFDGSSKTTNGNSINDALLVGPTIQPTLWNTLIKFRYNKIALTADIEKMYRQVRVAEEDCDLQRILWRENKGEPLKHYKLTTVTFGMASSAFLAIRSLHQTAMDFEEQYPDVAGEILTKFYIDDYLSGADTLERAKYIKNRLDYILKQRGFTLRKWRSNAIELSDHSDVEKKSLVPMNDVSATIKILGMQWNSRADNFSFKVNLPLEKLSTKRTLISDASKVFDPLGLVAPSMIMAKILFQKLWLRKLNWDDELPDDIAIVWNQLKTELQLLEGLKIRRFIDQKELQIHGFSDASERAYAAVVYCRFKDDNGNVQIELLASKTKVAPIKQVSLPRLELCGAHLLAKLITEIKKTLDVNASIYAWTDSSIVLAWLSEHPMKWKTFVANRVSDIQQILPRNHWDHVKSADNPADYASRGVLPSKLLKLNQWWHGPLWLTKSESSWPNASKDVYFHDTLCEVKRKPDAIPLFHIQKDLDQKGEIYEVILSRTFSFSKAIRILCFVNRFIQNARKRSATRETRAITVSEINKAIEKFVKWVQHASFSIEIQTLAKNRELAKHHKLSTLTPFIDTNGLLRVGGRLNNSNYPYDFKHPIILPKSHLLSKMIISYYHIKYLHPGPSHTSHLIRQAYWIVNGRATIRNEVRKCIQCFKNRATATKQLMGNLPSVRITPARPFANCGIDYAGPIILASKRGRGAKMVKGYIAVFVCMVTKAIHLEAVTELTTEAFIAALKRFSARRSCPNEIYSDNGTNFVGANRHLKEVYNFNNFKTNDIVISEFCAQNQINWHHIPPSAPHFGGLWESAVKSVKSHINRVTGNLHLTFEEMSTLLCQIEGILNSRPLYPMSDDDDSFEALTPAHFLMGSSISAVPEYDISDTHTSRLSRWQQVEQRTQSFWKRFHKDYLNNLQQRSKWKTREVNIKVGDLVLIKEDQLPSCKWALGRIMETHPDECGNVRVVTIKTASNILRRPIIKVCKLPME